MTSNCETIQPLLSEFLDDQLDAQAAWEVQTHAAACAECAQVQRQLSALRCALRSLPAPGPSAGFDAALAERLALTRRPATLSGAALWKDRLAWLFVNPPARRLRPVLALGAAATASGLFFLTTPAAPPAPTTLPAAVPAAAVDHAFVAECVAQRRREAAGEPLADLAAQNLAGHLDAAPAATEEPGTDTATADAGIF